MTIWTNKEIELIKKGKVPDGRTQFQCIHKASNMGISWKRKDSWTRDEVDMLKSGKVPEKKTHGQIRMYCRKHGLPLPEGVCTVSRQGRKSVDWSAEELELLKKDVIPQGRSYNQCIYACRTLLNKGFKPKSSIRSVSVNGRGKAFYEQWKAGKNQQDIATENGVSRQRVQQLIKKYMDKINLV